jgi:transcriptional regulator with XRE-family HTH domain
MNLFLRHKRVDAGLTLQQVADTFGIHRVAVSNWERGTAKPRRDFIEPLAKLLGVTVEQVLQSIQKPASTRAKGRSLRTATKDPSSEPRASDPARD